MSQNSPPPYNPSFFDDLAKGAISPGIAAAQGTYIRGPSDEIMATTAPSPRMSVVAPTMTALASQPPATLPVARSGMQGMPSAQVPSRRSVPLTAVAAPAPFVPPIAPITVPPSTIPPAPAILSPQPPSGTVMFAAKPVASSEDLYHRAQQYQAPLYGFIAWPAEAARGAGIAAPIPIPAAAHTPTTTMTYRRTSASATSAIPSSQRIMTRPLLTGKSFATLFKEWVHISNWGLGLRWALVGAVGALLAVILIRKLSQQQKQLYDQKRREKAELRKRKKKQQAPKKVAECPPGAATMTWQQQQALVGAALPTSSHCVLASHVNTARGTSPARVPFPAAVHNDSSLTSGQEMRSMFEPRAASANYV